MIIPHSINQSINTSFTKSVPETSLVVMYYIKTQFSHSCSILDSWGRSEDHAIHLGLTPIQQQLPHISHPSLFLSFSTVLFHVSPSRPRLLLISGAQVSAFLEILLGLFLNTCPNDRHLFPRMRTDTGVLPVAWLCSSSLLRWLGQNILSTPVKHVQWNPSSLLRSVAVTLNISVPYNNTDRTFEFRMHNLAFWLNLPDFQMFLSRMPLSLVLVASWCLLPRRHVC